MSEKFLGQIMMSGFGFTPKYFAQCNGQLLPINQNQALFSLLGTQYGGDGRVTFALPDLRGRTPVGYASSVDGSWQPPNTEIGQRGGTESVALVASELPSHQHTVNASTSPGTTRNPRNAVLAVSPGGSIYAAPSNAVALNANTLAVSGGGQPHSNMQPYSVLNFCIALAGIFPSRN